MKRKREISERDLDQYRAKVAELEVLLAELRGKSSKARRSAVQREESPAEVSSIVAKVDVGFGNRLFIRGEGGGLSWEEGLLMQCEGPDSWCLRLDTLGEPLVFKLLVNDQHWALGENTRVEPGEKRVTEPVFEQVS